MRRYPSGSADYFDNVMTKWNSLSITAQTHKKTDVNLVFLYDNKLSNCALSHADASHEFQIHVSVRILTITISQWARVDFCSYRKIYIWYVFRVQTPFSNFSLVMFKVPWVITDYLHCLQGELYGWNQKQCDDAFKRDMYELCKNVKRKRFLSTLTNKVKRCESFGADVYYTAVRTAGHLYWEKNPPAWCNPPCAKQRGDPTKLLNA